MAVQVKLDNTTVPFIKFGIGAALHNATLLQDAGRVIPLAPNTLMAKVAASQKWVPFTDETAVDGSAIPQGIYMGPEIAAADLVAGDVVDAMILVGAGVFVDKNLLVIENSKLLTTVINSNLAGTGTATPIFVQTVEDYLNNKGIFIEDTVDISSYET